MRRVVLDASVLLKWYLKLPDEQDLPQAAAVLQALLREELKLVQPVHCLLEVAAVLVRKRPQQLGVELPDVKSLLAQGEITDSQGVLARGLSLSAQLNHHLFDTLYHAVALEENATLITADRRYYDKAQNVGSIMLLENFTV
jgi:predicted nucleic acid-binding protein